MARRAACLLTSWREKKYSAGDQIAQRPAASPSEAPVVFHLALACLMESATTPKRRGPHIAVITPCYNAAKYVRDTVASVHNQTRAPLQHILVNDASTDETPHVLEEMASAYPVLQVVHHDENRGVAAARNTGARAVDTMVDYLCFLDADDVLHPHMLETMVQYMERHPDVGVVHCLYELVDDNGGLVEEWHEKKGWLERRAAG